MSAAGLFTLMLHLVTSSTNYNNPGFLKTKLSCKEFSYAFSKEGQKYTGIVVNKKEYLTNYENIDMLQEDINKQCGW